MFPLSRMAWVAVSHCLSSFASPACRSASTRFSNAWFRRSIARATSRIDCRSSSLMPVPLCPPSAPQALEEKRIHDCTKEAGLEVVMRAQVLFQQEAASLDDILVLSGVGAPEKGVCEPLIPAQAFPGEEIDPAAVQGI